MMAPLMGLRVSQPDYLYVPDLDYETTGVRHKTVLAQVQQQNPANILFPFSILT